MTKQEMRARNACKTVEKRMDSAITACWAVSHERKNGINCHQLHKQRGKLVVACRAIKKG